MALTKEEKRAELKREMQRSELKAAAVPETAAATLVPRQGQWERLTTSQNPTAEDQTTGRYKYAPETDPTMGDRIDHLGSAVAEIPFALMDLPNLATRGVGWLAEQAGVEGAKDWPDIPQLSEITPYMKDLKHYYTDPYVGKEESKTDSAKTLTSWLFPMAGPSKLTKTDAIAAGAATGAEWLGKQWDETSGDIAEVAAGISAYLASALRGKIKTDPNKQATDFVTGAVDELPYGQQVLAQSLDSDEIGTLADRISSPALYNVEETLGPKGSPLRADILKNVEAAETVARQKVSNVIPDAPVGPSKVVAADEVSAAKNALDLDRSANVKMAMGTLEDASNKARVDESRITGQLAENQATADALRSDSINQQSLLDEVISPTKASKRVASGYDTLEKFLRKPEKVAWDTITQGAPINGEPLVRSLTESIKRMELVKPEKTALGKAYGTQIETIAEWGTRPVRPKEIQAILKQMRATIHKASRTFDTGQEHVHAAKIIENMEESLVKMPEFGQFKEAKRLTTKRHAETKPEKIKGLRRSKSVETLTDRMKTTGTDGAETARLLKESNSPALIERMHTAVRADAKKVKDGVSQEFMSKHSGYLDEFPKLQKELQTIADANTAAKVGLKKSASRETALKAESAASIKTRDQADTSFVKALADISTDTAAKKSTIDQKLISKFAEDAEGNIQRLLGVGGSGKLTKELTTLHEWAKANNVQDSFKGQVRAQLINKIFPKVEGVRSVKGASITAFDTVKQRLVDSGVLTKDDVTTISSMLAESVAKQKARSKAGKMLIEPKLTKKESAAASALALGVVASTGMPHALIATSFTKKFITAQIKERKLSAKAIEQIAEFMVQPEKYKAAFTQLKADRAKGGKFSKAKRQNILRLVLAAGRAKADTDDEE